MFTAELLSVMEENSVELTNLTEKWISIYHGFKIVPGWLSQLSTGLWLRSRSHDFCEFEPRIGLCAISMEPAQDSLFLPLSVTLPHSLSQN